MPNDIQILRAAGRSGTDNAEMLSDIAKNMITQLLTLRRLLNSWHYNRIPNSLPNRNHRNDNRNYIQAFGTHRSVASLAYQALRPDLGHFSIYPCELLHQ